MIKATATEPIRQSDSPTLRPSDVAGLLPRKTFDVQFKELDESTGGFTLYAAVFANVDRQGDLIEPGAFQNLDEFTRDGWIALNHDQASLPIAIIDTATQDATGLKITGRFHSTAAGQAVRTVARERMAAGKAVKCSIGYQVPIDGEQYEKIDGRTIRRIKKLSVYEASFVNLPANPLAEVTEVKSMPEKTEQKDLLAEALKEIKELLTKGDVPKSAHTRLKAFAEAMDEHGQKSSEHAKAISDHGKAARCMAKEMKAVLKAYKAESDGELSDEAEEDNEGEEERAVEGDKKPPKKKTEKPEDTADGDPPKSEDDKTKAAYRGQLRIRATTGRRIQSCP